MKADSVKVATDQHRSDAAPWFPARARRISPASETAGPTTRPTPVVQRRAVLGRVTPISVLLDTAGFRPNDQVSSSGDGRPWCGRASRAPLARESNPPFSGLEPPRAANVLGRRKLENRPRAAILALDSEMPRQESKLAHAA